MTTTHETPPVTTVHRAISESDATQWVGSMVPWREPNLTEATIAADADTGHPAFAYLPIGGTAALRKAVLNFDYGSTTTRASGMDNTSRTFGYSPRRPVYGREGCQTTRLWNETPTGHDVLVDYAAHLQTMLADMFPEVYSADIDTMGAVNDEWKLGETTWTSGVVNQSSALPYHRDAFNFAVWTAMPVLRRGMKGGYLHIPEYNVTVESRDGWAVFFPGYHLVHGVTPMQQTKPGGYRYSVVYYALKGMKDCFTHAVETAYAKRKRTERERDMARRLADGNTEIPDS